MEYNLNIYGVGIRYILCAIFGVVGGLIYISSPIIGTIVLILSVYSFLEGILAFSVFSYLRGKDDSKTAVEDFK